MKKIFILSAFTLIGFTIQAQIKFGIKAGANFTNFAGPDAKLGDLPPKYKVGFAGGGLVNIQLSEMFSLQPELLYSMEGTTYKSEGQSVHFKTDYINIPVLAQYNNPSGFYAETGPQVGVLTSAKLSAGGNSMDIKEGFKRINFSWGLGAGYKLSNGFGIGARYNLGLTNIADSDEGESVNINTGGFHLGVFYTFGGGN